MRLIDADALMDAFRTYMVERFDREKCVSEENCKTCDRSCLWRSVVSVAPTVDAVLVVRCKDCKYQRKVWIEDKRYKFGGFLRVSCDRNDDIFASHTVDGDDNDFCSYGERKDGDGNG